MPVDIELQETVLEIVIGSVQIDVVVETIEVDIELD